MDIFDQLEMELGKPAPEIRSEIKDSRERIQASTELFNKHFNDDGKPKTKEGKKLYKKYYVPAYGERVRSPFRPIWRLKIFTMRMIRRIWRWVSPPVCGHCNELIEGMVMGVSINYLSNTWYHYNCYKEVYKLPK